MPDSPLPNERAAAPSMSVSARSRRARLARRLPWAYIGVLAAAGAAATALWSVDLPSVPAAITLPWPILIAAFVLAELAVVHMHAGRGARSHSTMSLSEVPLVLGLVFVAPVHLVIARTLGSGLALVFGRHQRSPQKLAFNLAMFVVETNVAIAVYRLILGAGDPLEPIGWLAAFLATTSAVLIGSVLVAGAISLQNLQWRVDVFRSLAGIAVISSATNTSLGLLAIMVVSTDVRALWLLLQVAALLLVSYRGYTALRKKHQSLELLHEFTRDVGASLESGETHSALLDKTRNILRAEVAEIVFLPSASVSEGLRWIIRDPSGEVEHGEVTLALDSLYARVIADREALLLERATREPRLRAFLAQRGLRDAMIVPLRAKDAAVATLLVGNRLGDVESFTTDDLRLLETIANHANISLQNGRLVDRLRHEVEEKEHQASHDALTGLPNRTLFNDRVQAAIIAARREGRKVAVMLLDLDRFKEVNDTLGHHIGDELLMEVGARLARTLQRADTVSRLGGDEFAILLPSVPDEETAVTVAERARRALEQPFELGDLSLVVGASVGIALSPDHGDLATGLLQRADVAMYAAKGEHSGVQVYSAARDEYSPRRLALVAELRAALERGDMDVHYQPKADLRTGKVTGVEALVRWYNGERGLIPPDEFIPIAERTGLIHPLTTHVIRTALYQCRKWRRAGRKIDVAVNLSVGSLLNLELPGELSRLLAQAGVAPSALTLEITESSIMADPTRSVQVLTALHGMGISLAIDDFGTGYSSLSHLKRLPVDELKIDKSFVLNMASDDNDAVIVRSTVDLGHNLGLRVVAEGVEDTETWKRLAALGCDVAQGYYLSRAMSATALEEWLAEWERMLSKSRGEQFTATSPAGEGLPLGLDGWT